MKKPFALAVAAFVLVGCGNFVADFGIPTVSIANKSSKIVSETVGSTTITKLVLEYTVRTLPGSPGGTINSFNLAAGGPVPSIPGGRAEPCEASAKPQDCPEITGILEISPPPSLGSIVIESYSATGLNGHGRTVEIRPPVRLY